MGEPAAKMPPPPVDAGMELVPLPPLVPGAADAGVAPFELIPPMAPPAPVVLEGIDPAAMAATQAITAGLQGGPDPRTVLPSLPSGGGPMPVQQEATAPPPPPPPPAAPGFSMPGLGGARRELDKGVAEQRAALADAAKVEGDKAAATLTVQDAYLRRQEELQEQHRAALAAHQKAGDEMFSGVVNATIDPNRVWANMDSGQRFGATIAIALGGIGAALAGGPNLVLQQLNRIIDLDIDAQKASLAHKQTLLSFHMQQGRDMRAAHQLAKADLQDLVAAQLVRVGATFAGPEAAARAQLQAGALRTDAAAKRADILTREFAMRQQALEMEQKVAQQRMIQAVVAAPRTRAGGLDVPAEALEALPKDMRERAVQLPDGSYAFARNLQQANDYAKGSQLLQGFQAVTSEYRRLLQEGHPVIPTAVGGERTRAAALRQDILLRLKDLKNLGVLQKWDLTALEPLIPDITEATTRDRTLFQRLDALEDSVLADADAWTAGIVGRRARAAGAGDGG